MLCEFEAKTLAFIRAERLLPRRGKVLLAVSGGPDSIALLHCLWSLKAQNEINPELICAHLNHGLRGSESDADETFVAAQAANLQLQLATRRLDINKYARREKLSIETAARQWRIETLGKIADENNCKWIATGHHKDDNAETVIQRILRGTGFRGLGGIWPKRDFGAVTFVRPLLFARREQIIEYLEKRHLSWRTDSTNDETQYQRNFIRHRLLPEIQAACSDDLAEQLSVLARHARRYHQKLRSQLEEIWEGMTEADSKRVALDLEAFEKQPEAVRIELVRHSLDWLGGGEKDITQNHYQDLFEMARQRVSNKRLSLPGGFCAWREYRRLVLARDSDSFNDEQYVSKTAEVKIPGETKFGIYTIQARVVKAKQDDVAAFKQDTDSRIERFDLEKLALPLKVRFRQQGDRFAPLGLSTETKIGKFLTSLRIPQHLRSKALVVEDTEQIIWLWPIRISEKTKLTDETKKILELKIV